MRLVTPPGLRDGIMASATDRLMEENDQVAQGIDHGAVEIDDAMVHEVDCFAWGKGQAPSTAR